jgi:hypothetical protein
MAGITQPLVFEVEAGAFFFQSTMRPKTVHSSFQNRSNK